MITFKGSRSRTFLYWAFHILPQMYIMQITQPSQYSYTQYRFAVISEEPSSIGLCKYVSEIYQNSISRKLILFWNSVFVHIPRGELLYYNVAKRAKILLLFAIFE